jgi:hypothetical protein
MKTLLIATTFAAAASCAFAVSAVAQNWTSCGAAFNTCKLACKDAVASPQCPSWCSDQMRKCKSSGCFAKAPRFGGGEVCNLKKS